MPLDGMCAAVLNIITHFEPSQFLFECIWNCSHQSVIMMHYWLLIKNCYFLSYIFLQLKAEVVKSILFFAHFVVNSEMQTQYKWEKANVDFPVWFPIALALNAARVKETERERVYQALSKRALHNTHYKQTREDLV